jgi:hypothetical protein
MTFDPYAPPRVAVEPAQPGRTRKPIAAWFLQGASVLVGAQCVRIAIDWSTRFNGLDTAIAQGALALLFMGTAALVEGRLAAGRWLGVCAILLLACEFGVPAWVAFDLQRVRGIDATWALAVIVGVVVLTPSWLYAFGFSPGARAWFRRRGQGERPPASETLP